MDDYKGIKPKDKVVYTNPKPDEDVLEHREVVTVMAVAIDEGKPVFYFMKHGELHRRSAFRFEPITVGA
jgi:hypothetical protein